MSYAADYDSVKVKKVQKPEEYPKGKHYVIIRFSYSYEPGYPSTTHHEVFVTTDRKEWEASVAAKDRAGDEIIFYEVERISKIHLKATIE